MVLITEMLEICIQTSYDQNVQLILKSYLHVVLGTTLISNRKIVERGKIDTPNTQIHEHSLSCLGTGTSIKSGWVKQVV